MYDRLGRKIRTVSETAAYINVPITESREFT